MTKNEILHNLIIDKIRKTFDKKVEGFTIQTLLEEKSFLDSMSETEIREAVNWAINKGILSTEKSDKFGDTSLYLFNDLGWNYQNECVKISVSAPRLSNYSIGKVVERNGFITTNSAFIQILSSAKQVIRISSPFLQKNVANENSLPEIEEIILMAYKRGCRLVILSREVNTKRAKDLTWLVDLSRKNGFADKLEIYDYHKSKIGGEVDSSTHAKLIIADNEMAYIGSAELRLNSIYKNFEVGVLLGGTTIIGLVELFDFMTQIAKRVY